MRMTRMTSRSRCITSFHWFSQEVSNLPYLIQSQASYRLNDRRI
jgi:hypothetical protein